MDLDSNAKVLSYYNALFRQHGEDVRSLGWSRESQQLRFGQMLAQVPAEAESLLDIGSGFGDLADFIAAHRARLAYAGWEINPDFLAAARRCRPTVSFEGRNILTDPPPPASYDAVVCIGALNTQMGDNEALARAMIARMYEAARDVAVFSATSTHVDESYRQEDHGMYYYDPAPLFTFARRLSRKVDLLHSYLPHDFMLVLRK